MNQHFDSLNFFTFTETDEFKQNRLYLIHLGQLIQNHDFAFDMAITSDGSIKLLFYSEHGEAEYVDIDLAYIATYIDRLLKLKNEEPDDPFDSEYRLSKIYDCFTINE